MTINNQDEREALIAVQAAHELASGTAHSWTCRCGFVGGPTAGEIVQHRTDAILAANFHRTPAPSVVTNVEDEAWELSSFLFSVYDHGTHPNAKDEADAILSHLVARGWTTTPPPSLDSDAVIEHLLYLIQLNDPNDFLDETARRIVALTPTSPPPSEVRVTGEQVEAAVQTAYYQIAAEKGLTIIPVEDMTGYGRANVPPHWREEAEARALPILRAAGIPVAGEVDK